MASMNLRQSPRGKGKEQNCVQHANAQWDDVSQKVFFELCNEEVIAGNMSNNAINKAGWKRILHLFNLRTGKNYSPLQLKNFWGQCKKDYGTFQELLNHVIGVGYDYEMKGINASYEWWTRQIQADRKYQKFKGKDCSLLHTYGLALFPKGAATGRNTLRACDFSRIDLNREVGLGEADFRDSEPDVQEGTGSSDGPVDVPDQTDEWCTIGNSGTSGSKRKERGSAQSKQVKKKKKKRGSAARSVQQTISDFMVYQNERDAQRPRFPSITECMRELESIFRIDQQLYLFGADLMDDKKNREKFMGFVNTECRVLWLRSKRDK